MRVRVKICGLRDRASLTAAIDAGADAVGFVFAESPRRISPEQAAALRRELPPFVTCVAVFHHPVPGMVDMVMREVRPDWVQTDRADFSTLRMLNAQRLPVVREGESLDDLPPAILYEGRRSGQGRTVDWSQAAALARRTRLVLAGGLHAGNVEQAIAVVRPYAVDVSSGVESASGVKDRDKIYEFVQSVRRAERQSRGVSV